MHGNSRDKRIGAHLVHAIGYDTIIVIVRLSIPEFGIWSFKDKDKPSLLSTRARGSCSIPKDFHFRSRDKGDLERGAGGETLTLTICSASIFHGARGAPYSHLLLSRTRLRRGLAAR